MLTPTTHRAHRALPGRRASRLSAATITLVAALFAAAGGAAPAHAEYPLVGVLTGGELRSSGAGTIRTDEVASDYVNDPATADNCIGEMCNDHRDLAFHQKATLRWDTTWLVDARYPGVPADPNASANAIHWNPDPGSWSSHRLEQDYAFPDDQGEGGHDQNPVSEETNCDTSLVARMPEGAETPLIGAGDEGARDAFDASRGRSFYLNAYGSTYNQARCGDNDRYGYWGFVGFAPVEGDSVTWDVGKAPREDFSWVRRGRINSTEACDPKWTDGTPRDTEAQCARTTDVASENTLSCALCVVDIRYDQHPGGKDGWTEVPREGTWDGNEVRITAVVENRAPKTLAVPVVFRDQASGRALEGPGFENPKTYTFPPGSTTTIEVVWRTDGFAWEKGRPESERNIQLLTPYGGAQQRIMVRPRPVVLVHGWNSDASGWSAYPAMLRAIHPQWRGFAVGDGQFAGTMNTSPFSGNDIRDNAAAEHQYIQNLRDKLSADHIDLVVHSMGGLISRQYVHSFMPKAVDGRPTVRRLVMLGTPNQGSPCADMIRVAARGIPTQQLTTGFATGFNRTVLDRKGVPFSIAAGDVRERTCSSEVQGDGVVEVPSAHWVLDDRITTYVFHTSMTDDQHLLDSFVRPRLALDPDAAKALGSAPRSAATAYRSSRGPVAVAGDSSSTGPAAAPAAPAAWAARVAAKPKASQAVGTADVIVKGSRAIAASFGGGTAPAFAFLAPASMTAELVSPSGTVVERQDAGSGGARAAIRWITARSGAAGSWKLRLKGNGRVVSAAIALGGRAALTVTTRRAKSGAVRVTARLRGATARKAVASMTGPGGRPVKVTLRGRGSRFAGTIKQAPAGAGSVVVETRSGQARLVSVADLP